MLTYLVARTLRRTHVEIRTRGPLRGTRLHYRFACETDSSVPYYPILPTRQTPTPNACAPRVPAVLLPPFAAGQNNSKSSKARCLAQLQAHFNSGRAPWRSQRSKRTQIFILKPFYLFLLTIPSLS